TWASSPIYVTAPDGDKRLFVVERGDESGQAAVRVSEDGAVDPEPFLTIGNVSTNSERGLLSMAFPPDYRESGLFYVFYTARDPLGEIRIAEYRRSAADADRAEPGSERIVLRTPHSAGNHNGGWIGFGPDGLLYITIGDNASRQQAQSLSSLYGKVLRIDPSDPDGSGPLTATIPRGNPFVGTPDARGEIFAYGLRNPFRASFAPDGDLVVADVGEGSAEEVNAGQLAGKNMGWPFCEGFCDPPNALYTDPVFDYPHQGPDAGTGCAVLGGYVVRDPQLTGLTGRYLYGDLCRPDLRTLGLRDPRASPGPAGIDLSGQGQLLSFGEDSRGCVYVITNRSVFRVAPSAASPVDCPRAVPPPPPPDPGELPDVTFNSYIPAKRKLARKIMVAGKCSISCGLTATGTLRITRNRFRKKPSRIKLRPASRTAEPGKRTRLVLRIPARRMKKIRKAARNGSRLFARVRVKAVATDGSGGSGTSRIRLVPRKRR
ncbi:MAG: PQQ-dependent sugar dehydrogenase, partial [Actinomycetota bacterium]|nr:PQQ-dependent sugar dehydrogenase [Actinomycetota bacterium]